MRYSAVHHFDASRAEGLLAYLGGFIIGFIVWESAEKRREVR